jgi:hypothetical protein
MSFNLNSLEEVPFTQDPFTASLFFQEEHEVSLDQANLHYKYTEEEFQNHLANRFTKVSNYELPVIRLQHAKIASYLIQKSQVNSKKKILNYISTEIFFLHPLNRQLLSYKLDKAIMRVNSKKPPKDFNNLEVIEWIFSKTFDSLSSNLTPYNEKFLKAIYDLSVEPPTYTYTKLARQISKRNALLKPSLTKKFIEKLQKTVFYEPVLILPQAKMNKVEKKIAFSIVIPFFLNHFNISTHALH